MKSLDELADDPTISAPHVAGYRMRRGIARLLRLPVEEVYHADYGRCLRHSPTGVEIARRDGGTFDVHEYVITPKGFRLRRYRRRYARHAP